MIVSVAPATLKIPPPPALQVWYFEQVVLASFALTLLLITCNIPVFQTPPPPDAEPLRIVSSERVTCVLVPEIVTTLFRWPPSTIVVRALEPRIVKLIPMVRFST